MNNQDLAKWLALGQIAYGGAIILSVGNCTRSHLKEGRIEALEAEIGEVRKEFDAETERMGCRFRGAGQRVYRAPEEFPKTGYFSTSDFDQCSPEEVEEINELKLLASKCLSWQATTVLNEYEAAHRHERTIGDFESREHYLEWKDKWNRKIRKDERENCGRNSGWRYSQYGEPGYDGPFDEGVFHTFLNSGFRDYKKSSFPDRVKGLPGVFGNSVIEAKIPTSGDAKRVALVSDCHIVTRSSDQPLVIEDNFGGSDVYSQVRVPLTEIEGWINYCIPSPRSTNGWSCDTRWGQLNVRGLPSANACNLVYAEKDEALEPLLAELEDEEESFF